MTRFDTRRIAITGMAINTPVADTLDGFLSKLLAGQSAITRWRSLASEGIHSKIGGDLGGYDVAAKLADLGSRATTPQAAQARARHLVAKAPWSPGLSVILALDASSDAGLFDAGLDHDRAGAFIAGHNIHNNYFVRNLRTFDQEPDFIDASFAVHSLDVTHVGCVSEVLQVRGTSMLAGAACASGLLALRAAADDIRWHDAIAAVVVGAVCDFAPIDMQAMAMIGALSEASFNDTPELASRPFDVRREGYVPAHGGGALVLEEMDHAKRRGATIYGELVGVEASANANHLPEPAERGEARAMQRVLAWCGVAPEQIDYINGHFTSTPLGDTTEINAIKQVFGGHAHKLKINATKSLIGHTLSASAVVELIGAILQMRVGRLHPTINIDKLDPAIDLDVCANAAMNWPVTYLMKNAFGFGGLNASAIVARYGD